MSCTRGCLPCAFPRYNRTIMKRWLLLALLAFPALAQLTVEPAGPCAADGVSDGVKAVLANPGYRVKDSSGAAFVEVWLAKAVPTEKSADLPRGADFASIPANALLGVIRYAKPGGDFRGQPIPAGVYTMRYNVHPEDGNHQGVAPGRDFILLMPVAVDKDAAAKLSFDEAVELSRKASGTAHPAVLFLSAPESGAKFPAVRRNSENHDILQVKIGAVELGITLVGKSEG